MTLSRLRWTTEKCKENVPISITSFKDRMILGDKSVIFMIVSKNLLNYGNKNLKKLQNRLLILSINLHPHRRRCSRIIDLHFKDIKLSTGIQTERNSKF